MPKPLSLDLRERVVAAQSESRGTYDEMATRFGIGRATFNRWVNRWRKTGSVAPLPHAGGQARRVDAVQMKTIAEFISEKPDATRAELAASLAKKTGIQVSVATIGRALTKLGLSRKKRPSTPVSAIARG
jgi:transposase